MTKILTASGLFLFFLSSWFTQDATVDYTGVYRFKSHNPNIVMNRIELKTNHEFQYTHIFLEGIAHQTIINGRYTVKGGLVRLSLEDYDYTMVEPGKKTEPDIDSVHERDSRRPLSKIKLRFEAGESFLKPVYFLKKVNNRLSLCEKDLEHNRLKPVFSRTQ